jgi:hypothetical protein
VELLELELAVLMVLAMGLVLDELLGMLWLVEW